MCVCVCVMCGVFGVAWRAVVVSSVVPLADVSLFVFRIYNLFM